MRLRAATAAGVATAGLLLSLAPFGSGTSDAATHALSVSTTPLEILGGLEAGEGTAVAITVDRARDLRLDGIAPDTGAVSWSRPYSASAIDPGIAPDPYVLDNVVVDLAPVHKPNDPLVDVYGINATTGAVAWHGPQDLLVTDVEPCEQLTRFCVVSYTSSASTAMVVLDPISGQAVGLLNGPFTGVDVDMYETDAKTETIEGLSPRGAVAWKSTIGQLFGPGFDTDNGWYFTSYGSTEVATVGADNADHSMGLDDAKTVGFATATGHTAWTLDGQLQCGGTLSFEDPPFDCVFTGPMTHPNQQSYNISYQGLSLRLQGFDPSTGAVTWALPVRNVDALANGNTEFLDDSHLVVQLQDGKTALLDTSTGATKSASPHQAVWCTTSPLLHVDENKDLNSSQQRAAVSQYYPCTPAGKPTAAVPSTTPASVGVTVDGVFMWASPHGVSRHMVGAAQGVA